MATMKTKEEIGKFIKERINYLNLSQSDLARKIANMKGEGYSQVAIKDNVSKWIRGERYPGTEYIYYLSQVLEISVEEILVAGEVCDKYDDRPFSLYAVAKSGNVDQLEKLMNTYTPSETCVGSNYDEYDKTILDYIIEFERLDLLKYLVDKGCLTFYDTQVSTSIYIGGQCSSEEMFKKIVSLAVKYDDLEVLKKTLKRTRPIFITENSSDESHFSASEYRKGYVLSKQVIENILDAKQILEYLIEPFVPSEEEWREMNGGIIYLDRYTRKELVEIKKIETLALSFNLLFEIAEKKEHPVAQKLISVARAHNEKAKDFLNRFYDEKEYKIASNGIVTTDIYGIGCITVLGVEKGQVL